MSFMKKNAGFTLVELIVVIAILGILAGVAIPTYSGYIEKAKDAGDAQELHNLNLAFAAACAGEGESNYGRTDVSVALASAEGGLVASVDTSNDKIDASMGALYEAGVFKSYTALMYNANLGAFVNGNDPIKALGAYLAASNFNGNLGVVTDRVDFLTDSLSGALKNNFVNMGGGGFATYLKELGIEATDYDKQSEAAILYLAQNAAEMDAAKVSGVADSMNLLLENILVGQPQGDALSQLKTQTGSELATYAAIYAVAEGIAMQQGEGSAAWEALHGDGVVLTDTTSVLNALTNVIKADEDAVVDYAVNGGTSADLNAYFSALQAVNGKQEELKAEVNAGNSIMNSDIIKDLIAQVGAN